MRKITLRSCLSLLLALCMLLGMATNVLALPSTMTADEAVKNANKLCGQAQEIVDLVVNLAIDGEYASVFELSLSTPALKSAALTAIKDELTNNEDLMQEFGFAPTDANKDLVAEEIYEVARLYYNNKSDRTNANKLCIIELIRFKLVKIDAYSEADALETAEDYHEINRIYQSQGEAKAKEYAASLLPHTHTATKHAAVAATCSKTGNVEYWTCSGEQCSGKYYGDANCTTVLTTITTQKDSTNHAENTNTNTWTAAEDGKNHSLICSACKAAVKSEAHSGGTATCTAQAKCAKCNAAYGEKLSHSYATTWTTDANKHWHKCTACDANSDEANHTFEWKIDKEPTEDATGLKHEECKICGQKRNENTAIDKLDHTHTAVKHAAVPATCSKTGTVEHWTCSDSKCSGKYYGDANCTKELTTITTQKDSTNHAENTNTNTWTAAEDGKNHSLICSACKATVKSEAHSGGTATCTAQAKCAKCNAAYGEKLSHTYATTWTTDANKHWHKCTACDAKADEANHSFAWVTDKAATEDATGVKHEECSVCGLKRSENTVIDKLDHTHTGITEHKAVAATCSKTGNVRYWTCSSEKCSGKYYGDKNCSTVLDTITTAIDKNNHDGDTEVRDAKNATCGEAGYTGDTYCKACNTKISSGKAVAATGKHTGGKATCTAQAVCDTCGTAYGEKASHTPAGTWTTDANKHWHKCTACEAKVDEANHSFAWVTDKEATEDATGLKHEECSVCGVKRSENTVIDQLDHTHTGITEHKAVAATCTKEGNVRYWTCSDDKCEGKYYSDRTCSTELETITTAIDKDNHAGDAEIRNAKEATCTAAGYTGDTCCKDCDAVLSAGREIAVADHKYVDGKCSVCGHTVAVTAPATPKILSCYSKQQTSVKVTWELVDGAEGYEIWMSSTPDVDSSWTRAKTVNGNETDRYTKQGLEEGTTYYFKVRSFVLDASGERVCSEFSEVDYMPAAVLWAEPYSNATFRVRLRWSEIEGAHGYQIWRQNADGTWGIVKTLGDKNNTLTDNQGATTAYSNTGLSAGENYTYRMRAFMITEDGRKVFGAYSDEFTVAVMPDAPAVTGVSTQEGRAKLSWDAVNGAAGYQIWMLEGDQWKIVKSLTDGSTTYTKYDLTSGAEYQFKVRAYTEVNGKKTFGDYCTIVNVTVK